MFSKFKIIEVKDCSHPEINAFIKRNHYSKSVSRGNKAVFVLIVKGHIRGVATFGEPTGKKCQEIYSSGGKVLECKRFCLAPNAPKNTASWLMGHCLRELKKKPNITDVISYADPEAGHEGIIYKASNYKYAGMQGKRTQAVKLGGEIYHSRVVWQKKAGQYTKTAQAVQAAMKTGQAKNVYLAPKHIYTYNLKKR